MKLFPLNEQPYIDLIRYAPMEDRLDHSFQFIDEVVLLFQKYGDMKNSSALVSLINYGFKCWKKICRYEIVIHVDDEGYEYLLEKQTYPDYLMNRFLMTADNEYDFNNMKMSIMGIYKHLRFKYNEVGTFNDFKGLDAKN